jgi:hypothetical protein
MHEQAALNLSFSQSSPLEGPGGSVRSVETFKHDPFSVLLLNFCKRRPLGQRLCGRSDKGERLTSTRYWQAGQLIQPLVTWLAAKVHRQTVSADADDAVAPTLDERQPS